MKVDVKHLPDDVQELKKIITQLQNNYEKRIDALLEEIDLWKLKLFGPKSEKYYEDDGKMRK